MPARLSLVAALPKLRFALVPLADPDPQLPPRLPTEAEREAGRERMPKRMAERQRKAEWEVRRNES